MLRDTNLSGVEARVLLATTNAWLDNLNWPPKTTLRARRRHPVAKPPMNDARECERRRLQIARGLIDPAQLSPEAREDWGTMRLVR